jgi:hypothetical protein
VILYIFFLKKMFCYPYNAGSAGVVEMIGYPTWKSLRRGFMVLGLGSSPALSCPRSLLLSVSLSLWDTASSRKD